MPSSRTPEGDPVHCALCGVDSHVEVSNPPGDSVCPVCGALLWSDSKRVAADATKAAIRSFIAEIHARLQQRDFSDETGRLLVTGLQRSLAAYGASLWTAQTRVLKMPLPRPVIKQYCGEASRPDFAAEVVATGEERMSSIYTEDSSPLLLGVPLFDQGSVCGAIVVVQRNVESEVVRRGYMRFLNFIADKAAPLAL